MNTEHGQPHPPVIILGMHRSGTTMITQLLERLGLFTGKDTARNAESRFFLGLNMWMVSQPSGGWANPEPVDSLIETPAIYQPTLEFVRDRVDSFHLAGYLGLRRWLQYRSINNLDFPWGWKDPNNTFTLPVWMDLFPDAKVIHIQRHGVDVAASLQHRAEKEFEHRLRKWKRLRVYYHLTKPKRPFATLQTWYLENGLDLWERYVDRARHHIRTLPDHRTMELRYEDFLGDPEPELRRMAEWLELPADEKDICTAAADIDRSRAYAFSESKRLSRFARKKQEVLKRFGYDTP